MALCCLPQPPLDALGRRRSRILAAFLLVSIAVFGFVDSVYVTVPSMLALIGPFSVTALGAGLSLLFMHHRDQVERDRQAELQASIRELEMKNTELERFTYTVSHDLKSPLVTIHGFLGYVTRHAEEGRAEQLREDVARIEAATDRMQLLLVELLQNLIDNAIRFMGDQLQPAIKIGWRPEPEEPVFFVRDNGVGIDPAYHDRVFGLFDKLDPRTEGTGVGLALARRIVEVHGGRTWIESEGLGTAPPCASLSRDRPPRPHSGPGPRDAVGAGVGIGVIKRERARRPRSSRPRRPP